MVNLLKAQTMKTQNLIPNKIKNNVVIISIVTVLFSVVSCKKEEASQPVSNQSPKLQTPIRQGNNDPDPLAIVFPVIKIDHVGSKTYLPTYSVTVTSDGYLKYEGFNNVKTLGPVIIKLRPDIFETVKDLFILFNFYEIRDTLTVASRVPFNSACYWPSIESRKKTIYDDGERYPFILIQLRQKVESILHISDYVEGKQYPVLIPANENKVL